MDVPLRHRLAGSRRHWGAARGAVPCQRGLVLFDPGVVFALALIPAGGFWLVGLIVIAVVRALSVERNVS